MEPETQTSSGRPAVRRSAGQSAPARIPVEPGPPPAEPALVLVVDDAPEDQAALDELERRPDVCVFRALSGAEALELARLHEFAFAIIDGLRPGMSGHELALLLRDVARSAALTILLVTGGEDAPRLHLGIAAPVEVLRRPIDPLLLRSKVDLLAERHRDRAALRWLQERLERTEAALAQAVKTSEDILGVVSHDLRTPLGVVAMSSAIISERLPADARERVRRPLEALDRSTTRMERMIIDLLELAKIDAGRLALDPAVEPVAALVAEAFAANAEAARPRSVRLEEEVEPGLHVRCDRRRMQLVLTNLVASAIDLGDRAVTIRVQARADGGLARIVVGDDGDPSARGSGPPGEPAQEVARGDVGLGLFVADAVVKAHGGRLWTERSPGRGVEFVLSLPGASVRAADEPAGPAGPRPPASEGQGDTSR